MFSIVDVSYRALSAYHIYSLSFDLLFRKSLFLYIYSRFLSLFHSSLLCPYLFLTISIYSHSPFFILLPVSLSCQQKGSTAMITAAEEGVEDVVELLLERGANIEASDNVSICTTLDSAVLYYTKLYCTTLHYTL
jgi:hypothetical protein